MLTNVTGYFVAAVTFFAVDMVWLGTMASRFYRPILGSAPQVPSVMKVRLWL